MIHQLTDERVYEISKGILSEQIDLGMNGYRMSNAMGWEMLLKAASEGGSVERSSQEMGRVHGNTLRYHLNSRFDVRQLDELEREQNAVLQKTMPRELRDRRVEVAIDFHDEPSYSHSQEVQTYVSRGAAHAGTTRFWRMATAYVMQEGLRVTVAMLYVLPEHSRLMVVERLLHRVEQHGVQIKVLYLDKGFCSGSIIQYLQHRRQATIMACPIRGQQGGTRALCRGRGSYRTTYTFTDGTQVDMAVVLTKPLTKDAKRRRKWLLFVTIGVSWPPKKVKRRYRYRFGVETSYRQMRRLRVFSTSRNPALRFFLYGLSFLLLNIWTWLRWKFTRRLQSGPYRLIENALPLWLFRSFLRRSIERIAPPSSSISTHFRPEIVIY
jgi:putative transposase